MAAARERRLEERAGMRVPVPEAAVLRDRVRWGPIWAGIVLALAMQLVLSAIGIVVGLTATSVTNLAVLRVVGTAVGIWAAISLIVSLLVGSYAAARLMPVDTRGIGMMHGVMVWALTLVIAGVLFIISVGVAIAMVSTIVGTTGVTAANMSAAASLTALSVGWFILWAALALGAAVLGGYLGMAGNQAGGTKY